VKSKKDEELFASLSQGEEVVQGVVVAQEFNLTNKESSCLVEPRERRDEYQAWVNIYFIASWQGSIPLSNASVPSRKSKP
jgi:hypothetical protein